MAETSSGGVATLDGWWDGALIEGAVVDGWWDGAAIQPVAGTAYTGTADLAGSGTLTATAIASTSGQADLSGAGTLSQAAQPQAASSADLAGTGSLTATGFVAIAGTAHFTGVGVLSRSAVDVRVTATAHLTGGSVLVARIPGVTDRNITIKAAIRQAWRAVPTTRRGAEAPARPWTARSRT